MFPNLKILSTFQRFLIPIGVLGLAGLLFFAHRDYTREMQRIESDAVAHADALSTLLTTSDALMTDQVKVSMRYFKDVLAGPYGTPYLEGTTTINNQQLPNMMLGNQAVASNHVLVDNVTKVMGGSATIFVKSGSDFVRASTTIHLDKKIRATGTTLDVHGKAIKALLAGKPFYGVVDILDTPYFTGYEPIFDQHHQVIGAWYVGYQVDTQALREAVAHTRFLQSGFAAVLDAKQQVRFVSNTVPADVIHRLLTSSGGDWHIVRQPIPDWNSEIIIAYPISEARLKSLIGTSSGGLLFVGFGLLIALLMGTLFRAQILLPMGADPHELTHLVNAISAGVLAEDGKQARDGTIMAHLLKMRTDLRTSIETLKNQKELLSTILDNVPACVKLIARNGELIQMNRAGLSMLEVGSEDEVRGIGFSGFVLPEHMPIFQTLHQNALAGKSSHAEFQVKTALGNQRWLESHATPLNNMDGQVTSVLAVTRDITGRKRSEQAILESEQRLRFMLETCPMAVRIATLHGSKVLFANRSYCQLVGLSSDEVLSFEPRKMYADTMEYENILQRLTAGELIDNQLIEFYIAGIGSRWVLGSYLPIQYEGESAVLGWFYDITERKNAEENLRKLSQAVEQSPESIMITDLNGQIEYVNEAFVTQSGFSRDEVLGQSPHILHSGKTPKETFADFWQTLKHGLAWNGEFINRRKDGTEYIQRAIVAPIRQPDGSVTHYAAVQEDVTEKKRLQEELDKHRLHLEELVQQRTAETLLAKKQAEQASMAKSEFLANMSHELRSPMHAILSYAELGGEAAQRDVVDPKKFQSYFEKITVSGKRLVGLINELLDLAKFEAGKMEIRINTHDVGRIALQAVNELEILAKKKNILIDTSGLRMGIKVYCDELRIGQVVRNILSNAIKFSPEGGRIWVTTEIIPPTDVHVERGTPQYMQLSICDEGVGIPHAELTRIFDKFVQSSATQSKSGGTGLGLSISREIIHLHRGTLRVNNNVEKGATFTFTLPKHLVNTAR